MDDFDQMPFGAAEFAENTEPRCPVVLLLDSSGSMAGSPIAELNAGSAKATRDIATSADENLLFIFWLPQFRHASKAELTSDCVCI